MTTQEVKEYYGDTPEQFCRTLCKNCISNDWYGIILGANFTIIILSFLGANHNEDVLD